MKKRLLSMLLVVVMMTSVLSLSALAATECSWCAAAGNSGEIVVKYDDNGHWNQCTTDGCVLEAAEPHTLTYTSDGTKHVASCSVCGWTGTETACTDDNVASNGYVCTVCSKTMSHVCADNTPDCKCDYCNADMHVWGTTANEVSGDDTNHYYYCSCGESKAEKHTWGFTGYESGTSDTTAIYKCVDCGAETTSHVHKTSGATGYDAWSKDSSGHWHACIGCSEKMDFSAHADGDSEGTCDVCAMAISTSIVHKQLVVTSGCVPSVGAAIKFTASVSPSAEYGAPTVKWNRVNSLSQNTSTAMTSNDVFAAGKMYNTSITVMINKADTFASDFYVQLDGEVIPFYTSEADFNTKMATYNGSADVAAAYRGFNSSGYCFITICKMYAQLPGSCSHPNLDYNNGTWYYNATNHYQVCDVCGDTLHVVKHFDFNGNGTCDRCGYNPNYSTLTSTGTATTHTHSWSTDWVEDISNHWYQCSTCGAKKDLAAHADGNANGKCDTCGFVMTAEAGHTHSFATTWTETAYQHYHLCSCGAKNDIGAHVDLNNSGLCDQCGYTMTAALNAAANGTTVVTTTGTGVGVSTGDETSPAVIGLWMAAFAVSVLGLGGSALAWRKRKES